MRRLPPRYKLADSRVVKPDLKLVDSIYLTPEHKAWREAVISRAGRRCEATVQSGERCRKAEPAHRMFADHITEVRDGGSLHDPSNGQCLCGQHHSIKTVAERARRLAAHTGGGVRKSAVGVD